MDIKETIDLSHRQFLTDHFHELHLNISDYTFANVYLFRELSRYEILKKDCGVFISAYNRQEQNYIMPLADLRVCCIEMLKDLLTEKNFFFPVPEEWLSHFPEKVFCVTHDDSESDYIYLTKNMASFAGKAYHRHRNHLNQFSALYRPTGKSAISENLDDAMAVLRQWQDESGLDESKTDFALCLEALHTFTELALWGTIYYIADQPAGFIIGEALNADMFCLHFAKASKKYHGIYEYMFNDTAIQLQDQYTYLNLEEDMGNGNLRRTKKSYGPERILKKYRVSLRG
ncbi:MAG: phosphatidylglycerol lysyltransferase domain-containing protein [Smithellaceae bacterium]